MTQKATFGAGCFWGIEQAFRKLRGVKTTRVGYMGGSIDSPTYKQVCSGKTGHVEVVEISFDPSLISFKELLALFWKKHDPTQINQQGPDIGVQYRSVIFYHSEDQKRIATKAKKELDDQGIHNKPIATAIEPVKIFYEAEEYHQQYLEKKGLAPFQF